jgi:3-hydroxybutyrate dehydrogenase
VPVRAIAVRVDVQTRGTWARRGRGGRLGGIDILVSNADSASRRNRRCLVRELKRMLAIHLDGAFLTTRACLCHMYAQKRGGTIPLMGSVHSKEASVKKGLCGGKAWPAGALPCRREGGRAARCALNVICPDLSARRWPSSRFPISRRRWASASRRWQDVMLKTTVDGDSHRRDIAAIAVFLAAFPTNARQESVVASHGWHMEEIERAAEVRGGLW